jgi:hypothetical protein
MSSPSPPLLLPCSQPPCLKWFISPHLSAVTRPLRTVLEATVTGSNGTKSVCLHCSLKIKYYLLLSSPGPAPNHKLLHSKDTWPWLGWTPEQAIQKVQWNFQNSQTKLMHVPESISLGDMAEFGIHQRQMTKIQVHIMYVGGDTRQHPWVEWRHKPGREGSQSRVH